ncbi:MAG: hypothetical protein Q7S48_02320 [bacterium]|nr:hypothetical protein [bacterium]
MRITSFRLDVEVVGNELAVFSVPLWWVDRAGVWKRTHAWRVAGALIWIRGIAPFPPFQFPFLCLCTGEPVERSSAIPSGERAPDWL